MSDLTFLCLTAGAPHARRFLNIMAMDAEEAGAEFILAVDGEPQDWMGSLNATILKVRTTGYLESVLDDLVDRCPDGYILRLDDDERLNGDALEWVKAGGYRTADHWAFRRANLWPNAGHHILNPPLWPDLQTRLSVKAKSGGRTRVHVGSPYGTGEIAPGLIEHHKFLVRSTSEREALVERYEMIQPGAGREYRMFSLPEAYADDLETGRL